MATKLRHTLVVLSATLLSAAALLIASPAAMADSAVGQGGSHVCDNNLVVVTTGARACSNGDPNTVSVVDTLGDGHHAAVYWSIGSRHDKCEALHGVNTSQTCRLPVGGNPSVCIRAANMEGNDIVEDHLGNRELSGRTCFTSR